MLQNSYITWFILYIFRVVPQCDLRGYFSGDVRAGSCLTLCHPVDSRLPGSSVHGIPRQEEWDGNRPISFSRGSSSRRIQPISPALADGFFTTEPPRMPLPGFTPQEIHQIKHNFQLLGCYYFFFFQLTAE